MNETSKGYNIRKQLGHEKYLTGRGIDIGAGNDVLRIAFGSVRRWDRENGDAQLLASLSDASFDFVYSSHCLEHMRDVGQAICNWTRILRPNGHLYIVVPDYLLYEKMTFPSRFNPDHKHTFSLDVPRECVKRANHWSPKELAPLLPPIIESGLQNEGFDFSRGLEDQTRGSALAQIYIIARKTQSGLPGCAGTSFRA